MKNVTKTMTRLAVLAVLCTQLTACVTSDTNAAAFYYNPGLHGQQVAVAQPYQYYIMNR